MPLSPADQALIADMKQRQFHIKKRQRATDAIGYEERRYRAVLRFVAGMLVAAVVAGIFWAVLRTVPRRSGWWLPLLVYIALGAILGVQLGQSMLRTRWGRRLLARNERRLREKYSGDLHAGRRWLQFYYRGEDISSYVPQILYFIDQEQLDSVEAALALAKKHHREGTLFAKRALEAFNDVAAQTNVVVVSSVDQAARPSSRVMRFVKSERPGVWFVTAAPEGSKVEQFDNGRIALVTRPTDSGATITQQSGPDQPSTGCFPRGCRAVPGPGAGLPRRHDRGRAATRSGLRGDPRVSQGGHLVRPRGGRVQRP